MNEAILPIISDPYYVKSTWHQETISGIRSAYNALKHHPELQVYSQPIDQIDIDALPPAVVVTNGSSAYVQKAVSALLRAGKHVVLSGLDLNSSHEHISCATTDRQGSMERMVHYLLGHGRKRIALVGFWEKSINDMTFLHAALAAAIRFGSPIADESTFLWKSKLNECLPAFIQRAGQYDAAICPNDTVALCLINHCAAKGVRIPQDLYLTGASNMRIGRYSDPSLTTIDMDFFAIGEEVCGVWHYVHDHLPKTHSIRVLIPEKLIVRASTEYRPELPITRMEYPEIEPDTAANQFFTDPLIHSLMRVENCLFQRDELDIKILVGIMQGKSYETLAEELFISTSAIRYRRNKIFKDADVDSRMAFELLVRENLGTFHQHD